MLGHMDLLDQRWLTMEKPNALYENPTGSTFKCDIQGIDCCLIHMQWTDLFYSLFFLIRHSDFYELKAFDHVME